MAEEKRVVYTYTGQSKRKYGICTLNLSQFTITEGEAPTSIRKITSITIDYMRRHDTTAKVGHFTRIIENPNGSGSSSFAYSTLSVSKSGEKGAWHSVQNKYGRVLPASILSSTTQVELVPDSHVNDVAWIASSNYPITITVTYTTIGFNPSISDVALYRTTANGTEDETGTYLSFKAKLKVESAGDNGAGTLQLLKYTTKPTSTSSGTQVYYQEYISVSTSGVTISKPGQVSLPISNAGYFKFVFSYTAELDSKSYTETAESPVIYIPRSFVNVHLAGTEGGGVCLGGYSSADASTPKFESHYPAYFYGGIAQIGGSSLWESLTPASASITSGGTYGDTLKVRKIENKCIIKGSVMITPESASIAIAELPIGCKPIKTTFRLAACQGLRVARIAVHGNDGSLPGNLVLEWVCNLSDGARYTGSSIWVDCSIEYWID